MINETNKELVELQTTLNTLTQTVQKLSEENSKFSERIKNLKEENAELRKTIANLPSQYLNTIQVKELISKAFEEFKSAQDAQNRSRSESVASAP